ncbi:MAG: LmeA family phospholipid-binding protein [Acidimicrobiales bacterium]
MRKLLGLAVLAVLLLAVDQGARLVAEGELASRAREAAGDPDGADATITSFPFLGRLLVSGSVPRVAVRVTGAKAGLLRLAVVEVNASGVSLDRDSLFSGDVRLQDIDRGVVAMELDASAITDFVDLPVTIAGGKVRVGVGAVAVDAGVTVNSSGSLVLRLAGLPTVTVPVVRTALVPCAATDVVVDGDRVRLSCEVDELPAALRR